MSELQSLSHTPGPWGVEDPMDHCLTIVGNPADPVYDWKWVAQCDWPDEDNQILTAREVKANARLIAAAPDLLEALTLVRRSFGWQTLSDETKGLVDKAISKALGETQ